MSEQLVVSGVTIFGGSINGWDTATPLADDDGDGIYEVTLDLLPGGHEYKFVNSGVEEVFDPIVHGRHRHDNDSVTLIATCSSTKKRPLKPSHTASCDVCTPDNVMELGGMDFKLVP